MNTASAPHPAVASGAGTSGDAGKAEATALRRVVVCVDDFGLKPSVNAGAIELAETGVVSAIGCMSEGPAWREGAAALAACREQVDVGLHLNLTENFAGLGPARPDGEPPLRHSLARLIAAAYSGELKAQQKEVEREIRCQLDAFEDAWGAPPDFVDGHQHVHQLPGVREPLLEELSRRYAGRLPWLRHTGVAKEGLWPLLRGADFKQLVIALLGSSTLRQQARARGLQQNRAFLGVYGFDADEGRYGRLLQQWLSVAGDGDELMCHPASADDSDGARGVPDSISAARVVEYRVLLQQGLALMREAGVQPVRLSSMNAPL